MHSKNKPEQKNKVENQEDKVTREEINRMVDKLNEACLELFPTILAGYYLSRDSNEIVNDILTEQQHEAVRKLAGI